MANLPVIAKSLVVRTLPPAFRRLVRGFMWSALGIQHGPSKRLDLSLLQRIRQADPQSLGNPAFLEAELLPFLGLNDEGFEQIPEELYRFCGFGLRCWQYPNQFSRYLVLLSALRIRSYLEIGVRHGGTFVITVEYLSRFNPLEEAIAVDLGDFPSLGDYQNLNPAVGFLQMNSQSAEFRTFIENHSKFDAVLIDGDHSEEGCRKDFVLLKDKASVIAFHDIVSDAVPGVGAVWQKVKAEHAKDYDFFEFTDQYASLTRRTGKRFLGIGVAVAKSHRPSSHH